MMALGDYMQFRCHACIGGTSVREDIQKIQDGGIHVVVGTPGRVFDMLSRNILSTIRFLHLRNSRQSFRC